MAHHATIAPAVQPARPTSTESEPPLAVHVGEAARLLGIGQSTTWQLIAAGRIRATRIAGRTVITRAEIQRVLAEGC